MDLIRLIVSIVICQLVGVIGSIPNIKSIPGWYSKIKKPKFNPPSWIFGPVWTLLYLLMGISLYLIWNSGNANNLALVVFFVQLLLNFVWSFIFFGMKRPGWAFVEIVFLWVSILWTIILFYSISNVAAYLLIPYILWVSFAAILNFSIWFLNR